MHIPIVLWQRHVRRNWVDMTARNDVYVKSISKNTVTLQAAPSSEIQNNFTAFSNLKNLNSIECWCTGVDYFLRRRQVCTYILHRNQDSYLSSFQRIGSCQSLLLYRARQRLPQSSLPLSRGLPPRAVYLYLHLLPSQSTVVGLYLRARKRKFREGKFEKQNKRVFYSCNACNWLSPSRA